MGDRPLHASWGIWETFTSMGAFLLRTIWAASVQVGPLPGSVGLPPPLDSSPPPWPLFCVMPMTYKAGKGFFRTAGLACP